MAQPVPVGFWLISLSVALPDEEPENILALMEGNMEVAICGKEDVPFHLI